MPSRRSSSFVALVAASLIILPAESVTAQDVLASADAVTPVRGNATILLEPHADSTANAPASSRKSGRTHPLGFTLSGYLESALHRATNTSNPEIAGRLYEHASGQAALNGLKLTLDRPIDPLHFDIGLRLDGVVGENARVLKSTGFDLGRDRDLYQAYATLNIPTPDHNGVQVKVGRMATFLGLEVIETPLNANVSVGNAFLFAENFTQTGVSVEHRFSPRVDAQLRVLRGWDQVRDVNARLSYMARLGLTPDANTSVAFAAYTGPEQALNNSALRSGVEVLASRKLGRVTTFVQGDYGREQRHEALPDPTRDASWWAAGTWLVVEHSPRVGFALRGDYMNDAQSARTGSAFALVGAPQHNLASATATLNLRVVPHVLLRPEVRFDRSNQVVFAGRHNQSTLGLSAAYIF